MKKINAIQLVILCLVAATSGAALTYALTIYWNASVNITISESVSLGVYWDQACTNPATVVDFGSQRSGAYAYKELYIKNTGNTQVTLEWRSDAPTSVLAGDDWIRPSDSSWTNIRGYILEPEEVLKTKYEVFILPNANAGSLSWTMELGSA